jgi:hypothetical protein
VMSSCSGQSQDGVEGEIIAVLIDGRYKVR